jgi:hypothetical protein
MPDDKHNHSHVHPPSGLRASIINWRQSDLPFGQKLRLVFSNNWIKIKKRQRCCDHPGEPGC